MSLPPSRIVGRPEDVDLSGVELPMWTVYDRPLDFPDKIVVRLFDPRKGPTDIVLIFKTLHEAQAAFAHWTWMVRAPSDEPQIMGVFL